MKICAISTTQQKSCAKMQLKNVNTFKVAPLSETKNGLVSFKGDKGALIGMGVGALTGLGLAVLTIATGGLAGLVAAAGSATSVIGSATGLGANIGGILGGLSEEDDEDNK